MTERVTDSIEGGYGRDEEPFARRDVPLGDSDLTTASADLGEHQGASHPLRIGLPRCDQRGGVVERTEFEQELGVVCGPPADARLTPAEFRSPPVRTGEPFEGCGIVSVADRDQPQHGHVLGSSR